MIRIVFLFISSFVSIVGIHSQNESLIDTIFHEADKLYDEIHSMHYFYRSADQFGIQPDTSHSYGNGYIEKISNDSLGYKYHITELKRKTKFIYDGKKLARIYDKYKTVRTTDPNAIGVRGAYHETQHVPYVFTKNYFSDLKSDTLVKSISLVADTIIEGSLCYQVKVQYKTSNIFYSRIIHYFFNKSNFFCLGRQGFGHYAGVPRHSDFIIVFADVNVDLDKNTFKRFKNIPSGYKKLKPHKPLKYEEPLKKDKKIPKFTAYSLGDKTITKDDLLNQITLLDFWYIGCGPCLKIAPIIDSIAITYKGRGVEVLGFNPFDEKEDIVKFKQYSKLSYESMIIERDVADKFNVPGYPAIFIINQEGRVAYSRIGGADNLFSILSEQIEMLLSP